ncbi:hypothetical protein UFOVP1307_20 [uncultured Caudovirales phage]|uniref:Uncharacterized protein n=1 Tax=uncultured Caudovirales phage TaxID=2100421 RepID=A0A6J5NDW6_9CAUD|nr:hypothetical protein UFOVP651_102 [uncultured Caudovirales phage]CAB4171071.1 hypothetical protein UFOVP902_181 [uncultured Caudovirales phage]CAB4197585.1 hypothetical protein UFOVP1307_20 [uncultured Caudovirales phage]
MLENIIKKYLFESRRFTAIVQKTRPESEFKKAQEAGAIYAFEVVYKIKLGKDPLPTEKDVMNTLDDIISADGVVGASSKYAVAENKYVLGTDLKDAKRRMKWNVWIVPSIKKVKSTTVTSNPNQKPPVPGKDLQPVEIDEVPVVASRYTIGASTLVQFKQLNAAEQAKYKDINEGQPFTPADNKPAAVVDQPEEKEIINKPVVEKGVPIQNLFASPTSDVTTQETENITTPHIYHQQPDGNVLYTMSTGDPYIYTYMDNAWYTMNKLAWKSSKDTKPILIKNAAAIAKLNATFAKTAAVVAPAAGAPVGSAYKAGDRVRFKEYDVEYPLWFIKDGKAIRAKRYDNKEKKWMLAHYIVDSKNSSAKNNIYLKYIKPYGTKKSFIEVPAGSMWIVDNNDIKRA